MQPVSPTLIPVPAPAAGTAAGGLDRAFRHWLLTHDGDPRGLALYKRHYSCQRYQDGRRRRLSEAPARRPS